MARAASKPALWKCWFDEFRLYHRKNGIIVKERDDIISATRYAVMMRRFAKTAERKGKVAPPAPPHPTRLGWLG
jgi:hypothetical protein